MPITLGSNIQSLRTQRSLSDATSRLESSMERLSSGMRINRASDDAAGLAVSTSLNVNARLYSAASRNINDGISLLNIVDSTISNQTNILGRMLELAEQSANGTYSSTQRKSLQSEYLAMQNEFARLADTTIFNGMKLLRADRSDGISSLTLQAGITGSSNSLLTVRTGDTSYLSGIFNLRSMRSGFGAVTADGEIDAGDLDFSSAMAGLNSGTMSNAVFYTKVTGSDGRVYDVAVAAFDYTDDGSFSSTYSNSGQVAVSFALFYKNSSGNWNLASTNPSGPLGIMGNDFTVTFNESTGAAIRTSSGNNTTFSTTLIMGSTSGTLNLDFSALKFFANEDQTTQTAIDFTGVETAARALESLTIVRNRMDSLNTLRGTFGAMMSRLLVANNLSLTSRENTLAAASRIQDVDIAEESGNMVKQKIIQQVATSILAQANQIPALAISLLKK